MCVLRTYVAVLASLTLVLSAFAQQPANVTTQSSPQAVSLLQKSLAALTSSQSITDLTLAGAVRRIAGSDDESGSVVVKAVAGTGSRVDFTLPSGPRSEIRNTSSAGPAGSWTGPDGVSHAMASHNVFTDPGWSPVFTLASLLSAPTGVVTYIGAETRDAQSVIHISASQQFSSMSGQPATLWQHLTQTDVFLDASTNLPVAIAFNTHADNNALLDIPVEMRFFDYRTVSGSQIPFRVQKFLNNSLHLDLQFQTAAVNTGLTAAQVGAQ